MTHKQKFFALVLAWTAIIGIGLRWHLKYGDMPVAGGFGLFFVGLACTAIIVFSKFKPTGS